MTWLTESHQRHLTVRRRQRCPSQNGKTNPALHIPYRPRCGHHHAQTLQSQQKESHRRHHRFFCWRCCERYRGRTSWQSYCTVRVQRQGRIMPLCTQSTGMPSHREKLGDAWTHANACTLPSLLQLSHEKHPPAKGKRYSSDTDTVRGH